jgi:hypothetical protein
MLSSPFVRQLPYPLRAKQGVASCTLSVSSMLINARLAPLGQNEMAMMLIYSR